MPRYSKGTAGKLIVQDWDIISSYADTLVLRQITLRQMSALVALAEYLSWTTRYINAPDSDTIDAFAADTRKNLMVDVQICALIIGCITDDGDVREALNQWFVDQMSNYSSTVYQAVSDAYSPFTGGLPLPETVRERNLLPEIVGCDRDTLFGAITTLIDSMHTNNVDSFEIAETAANLAERAALVLGAIPVLETLPVDEAVDYLQSIWTDDLFEAYNANDTTAYRDTLKCDLLCIAYNAGCRLSIDDVYQYFISRIAGDAADTFAELIAYLTTGTWIGTEVNDMFFAGQLLVMYYGNRYFSIVGIRPFQQYLEIGSRTPNSTWSTICPDCPLVAFNMGIFDQCGSIMDAVEFEEGVPFEVDAYFNTAGTGSGYAILLQLPAGTDWQVTLNSFTGTVTPPVDLNETAYAWNEPGVGFQNVLWNAPGAPDEFGTQDTAQDNFVAWCSSADWNAALFNQTPFTATFTVVAI